MIAVNTAKKVDEDEIYQQVFSAILEHHLVPNKKISEENLAEIFGVSRTIIRRILLRLSLDGAVVLQRNRGAYVTALSVDQVRKLYAARRIVERGIVSMACKIATKIDIKKLQAIIQSEHECHISGDRSGRIRLSGEFHLQIARIVNNELLFGFLRQLVIQTSLARANFEQKGVSPCSTVDHEALVSAISSGDETLANDLVISHLESSEAELNLSLPDSEDDLKTVFRRTGLPTPTT